MSKLCFYLWLLLLLLNFYFKSTQLDANKMPGKEMWHCATSKFHRVRNDLIACCEMFNRECITFRRILCAWNELKWVICWIQSHKSGLHIVNIARLLINLLSARKRLMFSKWMIKCVCVCVFVFVRCEHEVRTQHISKLWSQFTMHLSLIGFHSKHFLTHYDDFVSFDDSFDKK